MNRTVLFSLTFIAIIFAGCKKEISLRRSPLNKKGFAIQEVDFEFLETRARLKYDDGNNRQSANATIRIKKDSIIWFSVTGLMNIEGLRGVITRDSLVYVNRLNRTYGVYDYESLSKKFNFQLNYDILQAMLLGNLPVEIQRRDKVNKEGNNFLLKQKNNNLLVENTINADTQKLENVNIVEKPTNNTLNLRYSDFEALSDQLFAQSTRINLKYKTQKGKELHTTIKIDHRSTQMDHKELDFPFSISSRYERR